MSQNIWGFPANQSTTFNESLGYKKYVALLLPGADPVNDPPIATILENTLGSDIVWYKKAPYTGVYYGDNINFADPSKVFISFNANNSSYGNGNIISVSGDIYDDGQGNQLWFSTYSGGGSQQDNWGTYISVEIRVYP